MVPLYFVMIVTFDRHVEIENKLFLRQNSNFFPRWCWKSCNCDAAAVVHAFFSFMLDIFSSFSLMQWQSVNSNQPRKNSNKQCGLFILFIGWIESGRIAFISFAFCSLCNEIRVGWKTASKNDIGTENAFAWKRRPFAAKFPRENYHFRIAK